MRVVVLHFLKKMQEPLSILHRVISDTFGSAPASEKAGFTPWTMKSDHGRWPFSMVQLMVQHPWFNFLENQIQSLWTLTRCKLNVDRKDWPCTKSECAGFFKCMPKNGSFGKKKKGKKKVWPLSCLVLVFIFSSPKKNHSKFLNIISLLWALAFFSTRAPPFTSPTAKTVGPCQRIM